MPCPYCDDSHSAFDPCPESVAAILGEARERQPYNTIVADPPWRVMAGPLNGREGFGDATGASRPLAYPSMSVDEIKALPVAKLAAAHAHLYLWTTNGYLEQAFAVARAWGFVPSTTLVWAKRIMGGGLGGAYGISTEFILFCRRGSLKAHGKVGGTWFNWKRPYDERGKPRHSGKPPEFIEMVEEVSPGPYLELFARENRAGWDAWGNECESAPRASAVLAMGYADRTNVLTP